VSKYQTLIFLSAQV